MDKWQSHVVASKLYYKQNLARIQRLEAESLAEIEAFLPNVSNPYLAFSGGKDSVLMLALVRKLVPNIECMWVDEWEPQESIDFLDSIEREWGHRIVRFRYRIHPEFYARYKVQPILNEPYRIDVELDRFTDYPEHMGYDGVFVGMRKEESVNRKRALRNSLSQYLVGKEIWRSSPIGNWDTWSLWAYTLHNGLPVHPDYPAMARMGIQLKAWRLAGLTVIRLFDEWGVQWKHQTLHPHAWNRMLAANPVMQRDS